MTQIGESFDFPALVAPEFIRSSGSLHWAVPEKDRVARRFIAQQLGVTESHIEDCFLARVLERFEIHKSSQSLEADGFARKIEALLKPEDHPGFDANFPYPKKPLREARPILEKELTTELSGYQITFASAGKKLEVMIELPVRETPYCYRISYDLNVPRAPATFQMFAVYHVWKNDIGISKVTGDANSMFLFTPGEFEENLKVFIRYIKAIDQYLSLNFHSGGASQP